MGEATDLIFGLHAVSAALRHNGSELAELWVVRDRRDRAVQEILAQARACGLEPRTVERKDLDALVPGARHQGVVARIGATAADAKLDLAELLQSLDHAPLLLVLDGVQDPHNVGACLRSADAAGVDAVIVPKDRASGLTPTVRKVASGAAETIPFFQVTNLARTLGELRQAGVWLVGLAGEAEQSLYELDLTGPRALVLGAEEKGLRRLTREACDWLARIPMGGSVASLNVSVAAGVCLFEAVRQRGG